MFWCSIGEATLQKFKIYMTETMLNVVIQTRKYSRQYSPYKKDGIRRQGKGYCVCLVGRFCSISCRTSSLALVYLKEKVEFILFFQID